MTPSLPTIASGTAIQMTATGTYSDGSTQNITNLGELESSNPAAATVSATGLARRGAPGTAKITASSGGVNGATILTVD